MCLIPFLDVNSLNSALLNPLPLSDTNCSGIPCVANKRCKAVIVASADVDETDCHFEWASTTIKNSLPWNGPAWSICRRAHGRFGHSHGCSIALGGLGR